jgi:hypothetical protein
MADVRFAWDFLNQMDDSESATKTVCDGGQVGWPEKT